jgi:hypothetical protein
MSHLVPDWSRPLKLAWGANHTAPEDGWVYAEARNGKGASHPKNHSFLTVNGFQIEICCGGCGGGGVLAHGSGLIPVRQGDQFTAQNGSEEKLAFLPIRP